MALKKELTPTEKKKCQRLIKSAQALEYKSRKEDFYKTIIRRQVKSLLRTLGHCPAHSLVVSRALSIVLDWAPFKFYRIKRVVSYYDRKLKSNY